MSKQPTLSTEACQALHALALDVLKSAKQKGATSAEVVMSLDTGLDVGVRLGEVDTVEFNRGKDVSLNVYFDKKRGGASTSDTSTDAIDHIVTAACDIAQATTEDEYNGLADEAELATDYPDLDLFHPWDLDAEQAIDLAKSCETAARQYDKGITNSDGAHVNTHSAYRVYANSQGFVGDCYSSRYDLSCVLVAESEGNMQRDYDYTTARNPADLVSAQTVGERAAQRTLARLGARPIDTGEYPIIFSPDLASGLFGHFIAAISGGRLYRKASFLLDSLQQPLFPDFVTVTENPHIRNGLGSAPFDNEGVRTRAKTIVDAGVLQTYLLGSYSARRLGMKTTGNAGGPYNVFVSTSEHRLEALFKEMDRGLFITDLMGQGVNLVTGDYSRGACGFWIENGEVQYPVEEITIAGNLRDMYQQIIAIGNDIDLRRNIQTGSVWIDKMMVAGN